MPATIGYPLNVIINIMEKIEHLILENLVNNDEYSRHVLPHLKSEYFTHKVDRAIFNFVSTFFETHNKCPTKKILKLIAKEYPKFNQDEYVEADNIISSFEETKSDNIDWITDRTEKFCKDRAIYLALEKSINITEGNSKDFGVDAIPAILQDALAVSFYKNVGHDYLSDFEHRWEFYHLKEKKVPFPLEVFNKITNGGVSSKTLNVLMMMTNTGKSLFMCDHAAFCVKNGYKALYITLEMAQEKIAERIDCNLLDVTPQELHRINKNEFSTRLLKMQEQYKGQLVIKEYPTSGAHVGHFQALLDELQIKKNFKPDIIFVDYLNICSSQRIKMGGSVNSYQYIKSIAEELRGMAVLNDVPIISATQTNKSSWGASDMEMSDTSESGGLPMTVDLLIGGMRTEELDELGQILWKQLKSRYGDVNYYRRFVTGVDLPHFRFYDLDESAQQSLSERGKTDDKPVFDKSKFGSRVKISDAVQDIDFS
jgi:replicative DNA helicase